MTATIIIYVLMMDVEYHRLLFPNHQITHASAVLRHVCLMLCQSVKREKTVKVKIMEMKNQIIMIADTTSTIQQRQLHCLCIGLTDLQYRRHSLGLKHHVPQSWYAVDPQRHCIFHPTLLLPSLITSTNMITYESFIIVHKSIMD